MILAKLICAWVMFFKHLFAQYLSCSRTVSTALTRHCGGSFCYCFVFYSLNELTISQWERTETDEDIYLRIYNLSAFAKSFWLVCLFHGFTVCVFCGLCVLFFCCFGCIVWSFFCCCYSLWQRIYPFCSLSVFSFLTSCILLRRISDGQERAVSEMEE